MGSIPDKINYLNETKQLMKDTINAYGGSITDATPFRDYAPIIAKVISESGGGTSDYTELTNKPSLKTDNTAALAAGLEVIEGIINLHKIAKTGNYNDLNNKPTIPQVTIKRWTD